MEETRQWVESFVIALGLCPFAAQPLREGRVAFLACPEREVEAAFYWAGSQVERLLTTEATETSLLLFPEILSDFTDFLAFVAEFEDFLTASGADALVQLAHFHPNYVFADVPAEDPANATNRSPYPTLQLLRVASVAVAAANFPDIAQIPARNVSLLRSNQIRRKFVEE